MTVSGDSGRDAKTYNATFTLKDSANNCWADGITSANHTVPWVIEKLGVDRPSFEPWYFTNTKTRDYNGSSTKIMDEIYGFDSSLMTTNGSSKDLTDPGTYTCSISLNANCYWNGVGNSNSIAYTYIIKALDLPNDINQVLRIASGSASFLFSKEYTLNVNVNVNGSINDSFYIDDSSRPYTVKKVTGISDAAYFKISVDQLGSYNYSAWVNISTSTILNHTNYFSLKVEVTGYNTKTYSNCIIVKTIVDHS